MQGFKVRFRLIGWAGILLCMSAPAFAHNIYGNDGFLTGLAHPFFGLDHLLTIFAVGLLGMQLGGRARVSVPLAFLGFLLFGAVVGMLNVPMPLVENGIASSVVLFGAALLMGRDLPLSFAQAFVGIFALFHGHAHGTEIPELANPVWYSMGFVAGSVLIMIFAAAVAWYLSMIETEKPLLKGLGGIIASLGVMLWWF
ncbi:HupE/UreJ family protein [Shewanella sp.]|uniref:HupE/UreJ family protein n=1 Tax=Shewanella sp. TaxID=50422 RepID=UPI0035697CF1